MNYLVEFLGTDEVKIVVVIGMLICVIGMVYFAIEKYFESIKSKKKLQKQKNKIESVEENEISKNKIESVEENEIPILEEILTPSKEMEIKISDVNKEIKEEKDSVEQIYTAVKEEVKNLKEENNSVETLEYTDIRPNKEEAREEIRKVTEELKKAELEKNKEEKSELDKFEEQQEESAIISIEEFMKKGNILYEQNEVKQYEDEGNEPISLQDLEKKFNSIKEEIAKIDEKENKAVMKACSNIETNKVPYKNEEHIFKNSPIISPIFGIETEPVQERLELENTANYDKLDNEIKKTNEFLGKLKELKEKLN